RTRIGTEFFSDVEHRSLIDLAFTNHNCTLHRYCIKNSTHRCCSSIIRFILFSSTHPSRSSSSRRFCDSDWFHRKTSLHLMNPPCFPVLFESCLIFPHLLRRHFLY